MRLTLQLCYPLLCRASCDALSFEIATTVFVFAREFCKLIVESLFVMTQLREDASSFVCTELYLHSATPIFHRHGLGIDLPETQTPPQHQQPSLKLLPAAVCSQAQMLKKMAIRIHIKGSSIDLSLMFRN